MKRADHGSPTCSLPCLHPPEILTDLDGVGTDELYLGSQLRDRALEEAACLLPACGSTASLPVLISYVSKNAFLKNKETDKKKFVKGLHFLNNYALSSKASRRPDYKGVI